MILKRLFVLLLISLLFFSVGSAFAGTEMVNRYLKHFEFVEGRDVEISDVAGINQSVYIPISRSDFMQKNLKSMGNDRWLKCRLKDPDGEYRKLRKMVRENKFRDLIRAPTTHSPILLCHELTHKMVDELNLLLSVDLVIRDAQLFGMPFRYHVPYLEEVIAYACAFVDVATVDGLPSALLQMHIAIDGLYSYFNGFLLQAVQMGWHFTPRKIRVIYHKIE